METMFYWIGPMAVAGSRIRIPRADAAPAWSLVDDERTKLLQECECLAQAVERARDTVKDDFDVDSRGSESTLQEALLQLQRTEALSHEARLRFLKAAVRLPRQVRHASVRLT